MDSPAIIGSVDRQGAGQAIYLGHAGFPDQAGARPLQHYSNAKPIHRLIRLGAIARLEPSPEASITYSHHRRRPWLNCQPYAFRGGTERFFADYWSPGAEWLYVIDLAMFPDATPIRSLTTPVLAEVSVDTPREECVRLHRQYNVTQLPVVEDGKLTGVIPAEFLLSASIEEDTEQMLQVASVAGDSADGPFLPPRAAGCPG